MENSLNGAKRVLVLVFAVIMVLMIAGPCEVSAASQLKRPYDLKLTYRGDGGEDLKVSWKCKSKSKNVKFEVYRKEVDEYKYVKTVKSNSAYLHQRKTCSFAVRAVRGSKKSKFSKPLEVKCWRGSRVAKFLIDRKGEIVTAKLNGEKDGTNRRIKTNIKLGQKIKVSKFGDNRTGRTIRVTDISEGTRYSCLEPVKKITDNKNFNPKHPFVIEGRDVKDGGIYQCEIEPMARLRLLLIDTVQYHKDDYPVVKKSTQDLDYYDVGDAVSIADGTMVLENSAARNFLIQVHDPSTILYISEDRSADSFDMSNFDSGVNLQLFKTDGEKTIRGRKSFKTSAPAWEDGEYNDYNNEAGQWRKTNLAASWGSEYTHYWIRVVKDDEIVYEWLDLAALLDGYGWVFGE